MSTDLSLEAVQAMDKADPLAPFRDRFALPEGVIYLDGNSLGALPRSAERSVSDAITRQWGHDLISSWNRHDWIGMPQRLGRAIAPLIGALPHEVLACDSVSVNLFKLIAAALQARPGKSVILSEVGNFPSDLYMIEGAASIMDGKNLRAVPPEAVIDAIDESVALLVLTHVHYKTGAVHDMAAITAAAHACGALVLWDLSHSAGAVQVDLGECGADLAVGCGYKYLNGGPGAPAYLFVAERLQATLHSPLSGWMGHAAPFAFEDGYRPAPALDRFLCGTPPILAMTALESGLETFEGVDLPALFAKGRGLGALFIDLMEARLAEHGFSLASPREDTARGCHVSFAHPQAYAICQALIARGVIGDFRTPYSLRFGFAALYVRYVDIWHAIEAIEQVMQRREWDRPEFHIRAAVT